MNNLKKIVESSAKIRFHDCDPFGHLNNARYIDYMVAARGDQLLENYGFDIYALAQQKALGWVAAQTQIAYMSSATVMEEVIIQTRLIAYAEKTLHLEALMWNIDKSVIKAILWTNLVHYNIATKKSQLHEASLLHFFQSIVHPLPAPMNFDERVKSFRKPLKESVQQNNQPNNS